MTNPAVTVWYDGGCPLCLREIAVMRRLDKRQVISFIDVTSENSVCPIAPADLLARFHAQENGVMLSGAAAFAAMWRAIPLLRPLGLAAQNTFVLAMLERLYIVFLTHRPKLQRLVTWLETRSA
jgi:predicted DCC family thiol-disulfide oxidoreductase YuxK